MILPIYIYGQPVLRKVAEYYSGLSGTETADFQHV